ncbi:hypothetical protein EJC49_11300 [Aquibium carbonis]|uniref:Uncharacterized protein n=1 Tax=Aquibium carbonis TaxID=2495581 RepID=A0A429YXZ8_9HYPH|nr:hypothetical protein [Aquibium carbonis]RST86283.1 hypothetical protein EJC49_11300 [Aquibium carbonis]
MTVALSVQVAFRDMHVFPFWDMASLHNVYFERPKSNFFLFRDNEHLPFAVMPLFLADSVLFRAQGVSLVAGILLFNALIAVLLIDEYRRHATRSTVTLVMVSALFFANMFWLIHHENLIWPKQIHMYMSAGFTLLAFRSLVSVADHADDAVEHRLGHVVSACVLMTIATFSFAYGAVGWIAAILLAVSRRWPRKALTVLVAAFLVNITIYAIFYNTRTLDNHTNPLHALGRPLEVAEYLVYYFSAPVLALMRTVVAEPIARAIALVASSLACMAAIAGLVMVGIGHRRQHGRLAQFAALVLLFTLGAAMMTALSRLDFGVYQSQAPRYAIVQVLFWNGLTLLFAALFGHWARLHASGLSALALLVSLLLLPSQVGLARWSRDHADGHWTAVLALINGVDDEQMLTTTIFPAAGTLKSVARGLAVRGWSVYARPQPWWIGRPAAGLFRNAPADRCMGFFDAASDLGRLANATYVQGWAWDAAARRVPEWVVLLDDDGIIRSLARSGLPREDVGAVHPHLAGSRPGWRGYAANADPIAAYQAHAVLSDGATLCPLGAHTDVPAD